MENIKIIWLNLTKRKLLLKLFKIINLKEIFTNSTTLGWFAYKQTSHMASEELLIQIMTDSLMDSLKME
jgi:hypothetical protein